MYGLLVAVFYVVGLPVTVFVLLWRRRHALFLSSVSTDATVTSASPEVVAKNRAKYGFLYEAYGPSAYFWEAEELVRKLLLSAIVVLIPTDSPLQVWMLAVRADVPLAVVELVNSVSYPHHYGQCALAGDCGGAGQRLGPCPARGV